MLFPAKISEESPWKQETAISRLDADTENSTQEAIDLYFSQHHKITSPEDVPKTNVQNDRGSISLQNASQMTVEDLGGSPELRGKNISNDKMSNDVNIETGSNRFENNLSFKYLFINLICLNKNNGNLDFKKTFVPEKFMLF